MFEDVRLRIVGTLAALRRAVVGYVQGRKDDSAPLLIITFRADAVYAGLADLFNGHRCSRRRVTPDRLTSGRSGEFGRYLVTSSDRLDGIDFGPLEVLSYEGEGLQALASLRPLRFVFILLRAVAMSVRDTVAPRFREALCFEQHPCFAAIGAYDRRYVSVLKESRVWEGNLPFPDMRNCPAEIVSATLAQFRQGCESPPCPHCGAVLLRGMPLGFCCRGFQRSILNHLPPPMPMGLVRKIVRATGHSPNFPRTLNASLRPVLQHASVSAPQGGGSTLFITGIPYAVNAMGQFQTTVYAIFCRNEDRDSLRSPEVARLIDEMLTLNPTLRQYVRDRMDAVRRAAQVTIPDLDEGFNFAILAEGSTRLVPSELQAIDVEYGREKLSQWQMLYDQLVYPAIFWAGTGGCGVSAGDRLQGATTRIRKVAIALILQGREHFIHQMPTLREEFVCAISGRLINLNIKYLAQTERTFAQEDELQADAGDQEPKEYGLRTFIPPSLTDSDEYWHDVATRCFAISAKFGAPTFFLTFTMNPYWPEYQALKRESGNFGDSAIMAIVFKEKLSALMTFLKKRRTLGTILAFVWRIEYQRRGLPHAHLLFWTDFETQIVESVDSVINVRYPKVSPFLNDGEQVADLRVLIESYQKHHHSRRCGVPPGPCRFGYPQRPAPHTTIRRLRYCFARDADGGDIVPHNPLVLAHFRCHHCLEVIHSDQAIGYVLKYCTKNSDAGHVHLRRVLYEGHVVTPDNRLEYYAATRIASAPEAFAGICGFWRHHMKPTVRSLGIHLPGKKIVMRSGRGDPAVQVDVPSALERYLGRPLGEQYDLLTYIEYFAEYSVDSKQRSGDSDGDQCQPAYYANRLQRPILCMLHSVHPRERERFALRLLLRNFAARSWEELRTRNGRRWDTFYEAAHESGLVSDRDDEAVICMQDAVDMRRPPSDVRFLLVQMIAFGASRERLLVMFRNHLADLGDSDADINGKIDVLIAAQREPWGSHATDDNVLADMDEATAWGRLTVEQNAIAGEIVSAVLSDGPNLMFLQGSAGTGKTFTVSTIIEILRSRGKRCLICATTGVAAMQYHGGATLHSLFRLGIDEESRGGFTCNIGRGTAHGKYLLEADLIVIDEISMLTPWVAQRVSLTLQWVTESRIDFGGKKLLFVGDFLQLPPVIANSHMPVVQRLITRLPCWGSIHKLRLERPMRAPDPEWTRLLSHVARGERDHLPDWFGLQEFGVTITQDLNEALAFFCEGLAGHQCFPLDRQWIAATNRLADDINLRVQDWRGREGAIVLGSSRARSELITPFRNCPGLAEAHQIDFVHALNAPDLPPSDLKILRGDPLMLMRNIDTRAGLAKGRRCSATELGRRNLVVQFSSGDPVSFGRMPMEKCSNGVRFRRWQVPFKLLFAGTVHRSQGMTLARAVVDCRTRFWEHGQLYVALSRVRNPRDLCVLLPADLTNLELQPAVDNDVVRILDSMHGVDDEHEDLEDAGDGERGVEAAFLPDPEGLAYDGGDIGDVDESSWSGALSAIVAAEMGGQIPGCRPPDLDTDARELIGLDQLRGGGVLWGVWQAYVMVVPSASMLGHSAATWNRMREAMRQAILGSVPAVGSCRPVLGSATNDGRASGRRFADRAKSEFLSLAGLFRRVCGISIWRLMKIQGQKGGCEVGSVPWHLSLASWANETRIRVSRLLAIYRLIRRFPGAWPFPERNSGPVVHMPAVLQIRRVT